MELKSKHIEVARLLVLGESAKDIAEALGVTEQTICNWRKNEEFIAYYNSLKNNLLDRARQEMLALCSQAVERIKYLMMNASSESIQLKAAMIIIQTSGMSDPISSSWVYGHGGNTGESVKSLKATTDIAKTYMFSKIIG